jgi:hypothetical protein
VGKGSYERVHRLLFRVENHESYSRRCSALKLEVGLAQDSGYSDSSEVVHEEEHCRQMDV